MEGKTFRSGPLEIQVGVGDLTEADVDAIVNAANNHLWMGGGVAGAIKRKGGTEIEREAVSKGPIAVGDAVATGAGALKARHVIHAVTMGEDLRTSEEYIRRSTRASLERAVELGVGSIAFPALGTGVGGFSLEEAGRVMLEEIIGFSDPGPLKRVVILLFDSNAYLSFMGLCPQKPTP
ncbi:MAG: macro domain-containing protein [Bacillota bacterium]